jgi:hypothetical protein
MAKYNIFYNEGNKQIFIESVDSNKVDIQQTLKELNKEVPEYDSIYGLGYYAEKSR